MDAVMSQDADAIMWGSSMTLRNWSAGETRGSKTPTHVNVHRDSHVDSKGMILIAMLSGGDYSPEGVPGFGPALAFEIAKADFGADLLDLVEREDSSGLAEWRDRLNYELETNESGLFKTKHKTIKIPDDFPNREILSYYTDPVVSDSAKLQELAKETESWDTDIDVKEMREYVGSTFNWQYRGGAYKFIRSLAPALFAHRLRRGQPGSIASSDDILGRQQHFSTDGMAELRIAAIPIKTVNIDFDAEELEPETEAGEGLEDADEVESGVIETTASIPQAKSKSPPWDPQNVEKLWIPESIVKIGAPQIYEQWEQRQLELAAAKRKPARPPGRAKSSKANAVKATTNPIQSYFTVTKAPSASATTLPPNKTSTDPTTNLLPSPTTRGHSRSKSRLAASPKSRRTPPLAPLADLTHINPFTLSQPTQARALSTTTAITITSTATKPSQPTDSTAKPPAARKRQPFTKSKTLPASLDPPSPILVSSSPTPLSSALSPHLSPHLSPTAHHSPYSPSPGLLFKRTHSNLSLGEVKADKKRDDEREGKLFVASRASLKGTWREVLEGGEGEEVSLVDMTDD